MSDDLIAEALIAHFGTRCETLDMDDFPDLDVARNGRCPCCEAWAQYDELARLRADVERLTTSLAAEVEESERLRGALAGERRHGDELAAVLANVEYMSRSHAADDLLDKHRTRRQG